MKDSRPKPKTIGPIGHTFHQNIDPLADTLRLFGGHGIKEKLNFKQIQVFLSLMEGETTLTTEYQQEYIGDLGRVTTQIRALQKNQFVQYLGHGRYRVSAMAKAWLKHFRESDDYRKFLEWVEVARAQREARRQQALDQGHRRLTPMEEYLHQQKADQERLERVHEEHERINTACKTFLAEMNQREASQSPNGVFPDSPPLSPRPATASDRLFERLILSYRDQRPLWGKSKEAVARRLAKIPPNLICGSRTLVRIALPTETGLLGQSRQTVLEYARQHPTARALFRSTKEPQRYFEAIATLDGLGVSHPYPRPVAPIRLIDQKTGRLSVK